MRKLRPTALLIVLVLESVAAQAANTASPDIQYYRFQISNGKCAKDDFRNPIIDESEMEGPYYKVVTDGPAHVLVVAKMRDRKTVSEIQYVLNAKSQLLGDEEHYFRGALTEEVKVKCDLDGYYISQEVRGPTHEVLRTATNVSRKVDGDTETRETHFTEAADKVNIRVVTTYKLPKGALINRRLYTEGVDGYRDTKISEDTGLLQEDHFYKGTDNHLVNSVKYTYDSLGDLIRLDWFDGNGRWYSSRTFSNGQLTGELVRATNGTRTEIKVAYDSTGNKKQAQQYVDDKLICTFIYDRSGDGSARHTLAIGPNGDLWAEYQGQEVWAVDRQGTPRNGKPGVLQKRGDWWLESSPSWFERLFAK